MIHKLNFLILIFILLAVYSLNKDIVELKQQILRLEIKKMTKKEIDIKTNVVAKQIKDKAKAVVSLRCEDSTKKESKKWNATATKINQDTVLTADHAVNHQDEKRILPITCNLYFKGDKIGEYNSKEHKYKQVSNRDIAFVNIQFNKKGYDLPSLEPVSMEELSLGDSLVLITHPKTMVNDHLISFGLVLNEKADGLLSNSRKFYWKNAIISDMLAAPGSSGSPLFSIDGKFIGIHVGGDRDEGLNANYQLIFDTSFYLHYQLYKIFHHKNNKKGKK